MHALFHQTPKMPIIGKLMEISYHQMPIIGKLMEISITRCQ